ncbi:hypothetical protein ACFV30_34760 [Streptomyces sp. NPDC059752]|uniref:hypothetical protein n=1 Tax=unclassified Streptomyces TaxID=2593676 RepID=UPI00366A1FAB
MVGEGDHGSAVRGRQAGDADARVLTLTGVDGAGRQFAGHGFSPAGHQLAVRPPAGRAHLLLARALPSGPPARARAARLRYERAGDGWQRFRLWS